MVNIVLVTVTWVRAGSILLKFHSAAWTNASLDPVLLVNSTSSLAIGCGWRPNTLFNVWMSSLHSLWWGGSMVGVGKYSSIFLFRKLMKWLMQGGGNGLLTRTLHGRLESMYYSEVILLWVSAGRIWYSVCRWSILDIRKQRFEIRSAAFWEMWSPFHCV